MKKSGIIMLTIALVFFSFQGVLAQGNACSAWNRAGDLQGCLAKIKTIAQNVDYPYFWWGSRRPTSCRPGDAGSSVNCFNPHLRPMTLAQGAFGVNNVDLSTVNTFINIDYVSPPGEYSGCNTKVVMPDTVRISVDPTSTEVHTPWELRIMPTFSWDYDRSSNDLYTLLMMDPGFGYVHALWTNIRGNDIANANTVKPYEGPGNMRDVPNTYVFMLFKQPNRNRVYMNSVDVPLGLFKWNTTQVANQYQFGELVGLTWMLVSYDAYALSNLPDGVVQNCASLVEKAYENVWEKRAFLPDKLNLPIYLRLRFNNSAFRYRCGNQTRFQPRADFYVDPIGMPILNTADTRTESNYEFSMTANKFYPLDAPEIYDAYYTLLYLGPVIDGAMFESFGTDEKPFIHGMHINIKGGNFSTGEVLMPYMGPSPPDMKPHLYYFLLYRQPMMMFVDSTDLMAYTYNSGVCAIVDMIRGRCQFDIERFVMNEDLTLVGATWMAATTDDYTICMSSAATWSVSLLTLILSLLFSTFN